MLKNEDEHFETLEYRVDPSEKGMRLDVFVTSRTPDWVSRTMVQDAIHSSKISVNGEEKKPSYRVKTADVLLLEIPAPPVLEIKGENIPLQIIYEDQDVLVVNKPPKMMVHPLPSIATGTLVNALIYHFGDLPQNQNTLNRPGIVHRLDKETSGAMVVAKSFIALDSLCWQFRERKNLKEYFALLHGLLKEKSGIIELAMARHPKHRLKMIIDSSGKEATTIYKVLKEFNQPIPWLRLPIDSRAAFTAQNMFNSGMQGVSLVHIRIKTGRTHQIRVHFKYLGAPVLGDYLYGYPEEDKVFGLDRQMLHAARLGFFHPKTGKWMEFIAPLPVDFKEVIKKLALPSAMV